MTVTLGMNIASLQVQRRLGSLTDSVNRSYERLSSGLRIYRASDDAAGLAIAESLNVDARVQAQAIRNVNDGVSALSIAESALAELTNIVNRQIELAAQAANGSYSAVQRRALDKEANALVDEYNRIASNVSLNGINLFTNSISIQAGYTSANTVAIDPGGYLADETGNRVFNAGIDISTGSAVSREVTVGDMNGDGLDDLVTGNWTDNSVSVLISNGDGTFKAPLSIGLIGNSSRVWVDDLNGDGALDIVTRGTSGPNFGIYTLLGNGDGTFKGPQFSSTGLTPFYDFTLGDFNGDGNLDLVGGHGQLGVGDGIVVTFGSANGTFSGATSFDLGKLYSSFNTGDFNGDGRLDFVAPELSGLKTHVFYGNGNGTFRDSVQSWVVTDAGALDVNRDGYDDIIKYDSSSVISVQYGGASGNFTAGATIALSASGAGLIQVIDADDDGYKDIITFLYGTANSANLIFNNGDGTFSSAQSFAVTSTTARVAVGDVVGDGSSDLIFSGETASALRIFQQLGTKEVSQRHMSLLSAVSARDALDDLKKQLSQISLQAGLIGANQSRLTTVSNVLTGTRLSYLEAASRISDVDVAFEAAQLVAKSIQQKAAASLLAHANDEQRIALDLLGFGK